MSKRASISNKRKVSAIVCCCVERLIKEAEENFLEHPERSKRYIFLVMKFVQRYKIKLSKDQKKKFCRACYSYWIPDKSVTITYNPKIKMEEYTCLSCNKIRRFTKN